MKIDFAKTAYVDQHFFINQFDEAPDIEELGLESVNKSYPVKITAMRFDWFFDKEKQQKGCKGCIKDICSREKLHTKSLTFLRHILS